jgi:hypothetical protein
MVGSFNRRTTLATATPPGKQPRAARVDVPQQRLLRALRGSMLHARCKSGHFGLQNPISAVFRPIVGAGLAGYTRLATGGGHQGE